MESQLQLLVSDVPTGSRRQKGNCTLTCANCSVVFRGYSSRRFCSKRCARVFEWENPAGCRYAERRSLRTCEHCGVEFRELTKSRKKYRARYCSLECKGAGLASLVGETRIHPDGYVWERVSRDDEIAMKMVAVNATGYFVRQHRLVMARKFGRALQSWEQVHHVNGDKADNRIENLQLRIGNHGSGQALRCRCCGSDDIVFEELAA